MKFTRLNENSIRCVVSRQEMNAYGVDINDLMADREKAEGFLRLILTEAQDQVDFRASGEALNVQLSVMPEGDISLMISDDQNEAIRLMLEQFKDRLKNFSEYLLGEKDKIIKNQPDVKPYKPVAFDKEQDIREVLSEAGEDDPLLMTLWCEFDKLEQVIMLSKSLTHLGDVESDLYKFRDRYYLGMKVIQSKRQMPRNIFAVAEYSRFLFYDPNLEARIQEMGQSILMTHALRDLQEL